MAALFIVALASLSVGNALWSETLVIGGDAATGYMSVEWRTGSSAITTGEDDPLSVASVNCYRDATDLQKVIVSLTNAYPGYEASCAFKWYNTGTIPVQVQFLDIQESPIVPPGSVVPVSLDVTGDAQADLEVSVEGQVGSIYNQPPPNSGSTNSITVKILPGAPETTTLTFEAHVNIIQAPHPAP